MKFAINYSTQAAVLLALSRIKIDRFKCPDWPEMITEASKLGPIAIHFNLFAGRGKLHKTNFDQIEQLAAITKTPYVNLHLESRRSDFPDISIETTDHEHLNRVFNRMHTEVMLAVKRFGSERVIIENVPYRPVGNTLRPSAEPELINWIVDDTGCGLLLDISHASITAAHFGISTEDYINQLPLRSLKEMHFTGVVDLGGWLQDHLPAEEKDWQILEWALDQIRGGKWPEPWLLAFEYGGVGEKFTWRTSAQVIETQSRRLNNLISWL